MRCARSLVESELGRAHRLQREEDDHADGRRDEQEATASTLDHEGSADGECQVPDLQNAVDEELNGRVGDADGVENLVEVVRHETVAGPLREEREGDDDAHALEVTRRSEQRLVANVGGDGAVEVDLSLDLLELVAHERVLLVAVGVVVCKGLERLCVTALGHEPTRRLRHKPDEEDLENGGNALESGRCAPRPLALDVLGAKAGPRSAV
jgi:hypothetical protein